MTGHAITRRIWCAGFRGEPSEVRLVENPGNRGKGYCVRNGMLKARGDVIVFSDADLSSPIEEMPKLLQAMTRVQTSP